MVSLFWLCVHVDDILLAGKSQQKIDEVKTELGRRFQLKDMGELHHFLGVSVKQNSKTGKTSVRLRTVLVLHTCASSTIVQLFGNQ